MSRRSACRSPHRCRTQRGSPGGFGSRGRTRLPPCSSATARHPRARSTRARTSPAVVKAPLVLVCNNNQWAISTPLEAQTAAARLSDKAIGYGMPALRVDGHDVLAVYEAVREGVGARACRATARRSSRRSRTAPRRMPRPTIRACTSTRTASPPIANETACRPSRGTCAASGCSTTSAPPPSARRRWRLMRAGIEAAEAEPPGDPELVFAHAYADPPPALARDLEDLRRVHGR